MPFFNTPIEAVLTIFAICGGLGWVIVWREIEHQNQIAAFKRKITSLEDRVSVLSEIIIRRFPSEAAALHIDGDVSNSTVNTAGRDASSRRGT